MQIRKENFILNTSDAIQLAIVIITGISVIGTAVYTIINSYQSKRSTKVLRFSSRKDKLKGAIASFDAVYLATDTLEASLLLLTNVKNAAVNLANSAQRNLARNNEQLINDTKDFSNYWKQFIDCLTTNNINHEQLGKDGWLFINNSMTYIDTMDQDDYQTHELINSIASELTLFLSNPRKIPAKKSSKTK